MTVRAARLVRGWAAAFAATAVAAASHVLGGGAAPEPAIVLFSLAMSGMAGCLLAGRSLSLLRLSAAVVFSQGLFHLLFSLGSAPATVGTQAGHAGHAGFLGAVAEHSLAAEPVQAAAAAGFIMWSSHALAAAATVWLLACGEKTARRLIEALGLRPGALLPLFQPEHLARPVAQVLAYRPRNLRNLGIPLLTFRHRGPPAAFVSA
ncbi:hypothetical protein [Arthrobacter sp. Helios]|uniref:hypothetical protein n=1 Tax=Arthrobacter sp. Helios TaxID=2828862 RepID=UPI002070AC6E|nr:hypothetical protein [Arthrobacter sp. Helios]UPO75954.1 hypothetical protein ArtHe_11345 [Arthrobacter sp. Helios]